MINAHGPVTPNSFSCFRDGHHSRVLPSVRKEANIKTVVDKKGKVGPSRGKEGLEVTSSPARRACGRGVRSRITTENSSAVKDPDEEGLGWATYVLSGPAAVPDATPLLHDHGAGARASLFHVLLPLLQTTVSLLAATTDTSFRDGGLLSIPRPASCGLRP